MSKNVKVAIIDSGLSELYIQILEDRILGGCSYYFNEYDEISKNSNYIDSCGHGTICTSIISNMSSNASFYIIKILDNNGKANGNLLVRALEDLIDSGIDIINLSVSTSEDKYTNSLDRVCNRLMGQGKIIISSKQNFGLNVSYPSSLNSVIGVQGSMFCNQNTIWFDKNKQIQCVADSSPKIIKISSDRYIIGKRNSKATAIVTGAVAKIAGEKECKTGFDGICDILNTISTVKSWTELDLIEVHKNLFNGVESRISNKTIFNIDIKKIEDALVNCLKIENKNRNQLYKCMYNPDIGLTVDKFVDILESLEHELGVKLNYEMAELFDFYNIYSISDAIESKWLA